MNADELAKLMEKEEPLADELLPYVFTFGAFSGLNHPLVQEIPLRDTKHCALIHHRFRQKQAALGSALQDKDWNTVIFLHERPYRLEALASILQDYKVPPEVVAPLVAEVWTDSENIRQNQKGWQHIWSTLPNPQLVMDAEEQKAFAALPDIFFVYRGLRSQRYNRKGLSWTLDLDKAWWFAYRFKPARPTVLKAAVAKADVYALFLGRNEQEIVVDPKHLTTIHEVAPLL